MSLKDHSTFAPAIDAENSSLLDDYVCADWVFAYGSLIWNPEIDFESAHLGKVFGHHRNFCVQSTKYRGTPASPGVVLGLDQGGSCVGMAFKLRTSTKADSLDKLYRREMLNKIYTPTLVNVHLQGTDNKVKALTFAANRQHTAYMCLTDEQLIGRLTICAGDRGANKDYALNTWLALKEHGVKDERLEKIAQKLMRLDARV
jgi:glutathione-specific gamma-glutamylcyclotransferase